MMRTFTELIGGSGKSRGVLAEHVRDRRDEKFERAEAESVEEHDDRPIGDLRICALTGDPMLATDLQLEAEQNARRLRIVRSKANR